MAGTLPVRDGQANIRQIDTDSTGGVDTQVVKLRVGADNKDGGLVDSDNALPVMLSAFFKRLFQVFSRFRFSSSSALVVDANGSTVACNINASQTLATVTTVGTVSAMTQGNMSLGDIGKAATVQSATQQSFAVSVGSNFVRS